MFGSSIVDGHPPKTAARARCFIGGCGQESDVSYPLHVMTKGDASLSRGNEPVFDGGPCLAPSTARKLTADGLSRANHRGTDVDRCRSWVRNAPFPHRSKFGRYSVINKMAFQFTCPQGHLLSAEESQAGQTCYCPQCHIGFVIPSPQPPSYPAASPPARAS